MVNYVSQLVLVFLLSSFFTHRIAQAEKYVPELHYYFVPLALIIIGTYIITTCFFSVYSMAVDTLFICAIQDIQLQESNKDHHLMMPKRIEESISNKR